MKPLFPILAGLLYAALSSTALAAPPPACTLLVDAASGRVIGRQGADCDRRNSPASTFKIALSVLGFQAGVLQDAHTPALPYKPAYKAERESWRQTTDPTRWLAESVIWYSREITRALGPARFQAGVDALGYGNRDLRGDPGKANGLTNAWLSSSLQISPVEEVAFLRRLLDRKLPVPRAAMDQTVAIMPRFAAGGWTVHGKTGTGFQPGANGVADRGRQFGWFVGWAERGGRRVVFARLVKDQARASDSAGLRARDSLLADLPALAR